MQFNITTKKYNLICPETMLYKVNQSPAMRKWHDLTYYSWCDKKLDSGHKDLTVANLLIVNVNAEAEGYTYWGGGGCLGQLSPLEIQQSEYDAGSLPPRNKKSYISTAPLLKNSRYGTEVVRAV